MSEPSLEDSFTIGANSLWDKVTDEGKVTNPVLRIGHGKDIDYSTIEVKCLGCHEAVMRFGPVMTDHVLRVYNVSFECPKCHAYNDFGTQHGPNQRTNTYDYDKD